MLCVVEDNKVNLANTIIFQSVTIHTIYFCLYNGIQIMCGLKLSVIVTVGLRFFRPCVGRVGHCDTGYGDNAPDDSLASHRQCG